MESLHINGATRIPLSDVVIRASRSSGPGGQHANMTSSRIEVAFDVRASRALSPGQQELVIERLGPVVRAVSQDARSQSRNRDLALERLAERLRDALHVQAKRRPSAPSRNAKRKRVESKVKRGQIKKDRGRPSGDW
jgi:ribosome-associated protein